MSAELGRDGMSARLIATEIGRSPSTQRATGVDAIELREWCLVKAAAEGEPRQ